MKEDGTWQEGETDFRGTLLRITLPTQLPKTTAALLDEARTEGEQEAAKALELVLRMFGSFPPSPRLLLSLANV